MTTQITSANKAHIVPVHLCSAAALPSLEVFGRDLGGFISQKYLIHQQTSD